VGRPAKTGHIFCSGGISAGFAYSRQLIDLSADKLFRLRRSFPISGVPENVVA
jgi:hypothetical protein